MFRESTKKECPICGVELNRNNYEKHLKKVHGETLTSIVEPDDGTVNYEKTMYRCKQCRKLFGKAATTKHLATAHDFRPNDTETSHRLYFTEVKQSVTRRPKTPSKPKSSSTSLSSMESLMQASKDIGISKKAFREAGLSKPEISESYFDCSICLRPVKHKNAQRHFKRIHNWDLKTRSMVKANMGDSPANKRFSSGDETESENEFFNRTRILSGGAFGLGKNRKH